MIRLAILFMVLAGTAHAQVRQCSTTVTPGHVATWTTQGCIQDGGTPTTPQNLSGLGITSSNQASVGINNAVNTGPYNQLGLGVTAGGGYITLMPYNSASALPLNIVASSLNFIVNGTSYPFPGSQGPYLPLTGGTMVGTLGQNITTTVWSGGYPGTNNIANYSAQSYVGAPTTGFQDSGGDEIPLNLSYIQSDTLTWNPYLSSSNGSVIGWDYVYRFGGGSIGGPRVGAQIDFSMTGTVPWAPSNIANSAFRIISGGTANFSGATSGSGNGRGGDYAEYFTYGNIGAGVYRYEISGAEWDFTPASGSSAQYAYGLKLENQAPSGWTPYATGSMLTFGASTGTLPHIITFGDPQGGIFPGTASGDLIYAITGTTGNAIDFSNLTATNILKSPNFNLSGIGGVVAQTYTAGAGVADTLNLSGGGTGGPVNFYAASGTDTNVSIAYSTQGTGSHMFYGGTDTILTFRINTVASAVSYLQISPAASGNTLIDNGGTGAGISIGASSALGVTLGRSGQTTTLNGPVVLGTLATGSAATYACFTSGGQLISSGSAC